MKTIEDALAHADEFDGPGSELRSVVMLAAEVRRLRDDVNGLTGTADRLENENAALRTDAEAMNRSLEMMQDENKRLKDLMAKRSREHQQEMTSYRLRVKSQDDATFSALREENERLADDMERCYRMLLSEPDVKGALFKAENILRESLADRSKK